MQPESDVPPDSLLVGTIKTSPTLCALHNMNKERPAFGHMLLDSDFVGTCETCPASHNLGSKKAKVPGASHCVMVSQVTLQAHPRLENAM